MAHVLLPALSCVPDYFLRLLVRTHVPPPLCVPKPGHSHSVKQQLRSEEPPSKKIDKIEESCQSKAPSIPKRQMRVRNSRGISVWEMGKTKPEQEGAV